VPLYFLQSTCITAILGFSIVLFVGIKKEKKERKKKKRKKM
jgi:hypothetical protein